MSLRTTFIVSYADDADGCPRGNLEFHRPCNSLADARALADDYNRNPDKQGIIHTIVSPRGISYPVYTLRRATGAMLDRKAAS